jgi:hypothetical protein
MLGSINPKMVIPLGLGSVLSKSYIPLRSKYLRVPDPEKPCVIQVDDYDPL